MKTLLNYLESLQPDEREAEGHRQYEEALGQLYAQLGEWFSEIGATPWSHVTTVRQGKKVRTTYGKGWRKGSFSVLFLPRDYELLGSGAPRGIALTTLDAGVVVP